MTTLRRPLLRWLASFVGFPLGGLAAMTLVGEVDSTSAALAGGAVTGVVLGTVQAVALGLDRKAGGSWAASTAVGLAAGLTVGANLVGFDTAMGDLALQGAVSGLAVGAAQAVALHKATPLAVVWPAYLAAAWALGWTITTAIGVQVEDQFTVFGSAGAITVAALTTVLPRVLSRSNH